MQTKNTNHRNFYGDENVNTGSIFMEITERLILMQRIAIEIPISTVLASPCVNPQELFESQSVIFSVDSVAEIEKIIERMPAREKQETLVLSDFDATTATICPNIMSDVYSVDRKAFLQSLKEAKRSDGSSGREAVETAFNEQKYVLVEGQQTLSFIEKLKKDYQHVMIFTARRTGKPRSFSQETTQESFVKILQELKLNFTGSLHNDEQVELNIKDNKDLENSRLPPFDVPGPPMCHKGTIFSNNLKKGPVLEAFIELMKKQGNNITSIIFIDDNRSNLCSVQEACKRINIRFIGFHYTAAYKNACALNPAIIHLQKSYLLDMRNNRLLSDGEAEYLLARQNPIVPMTSPGLRFFRNSRGIPEVQANVANLHSYVR